MNYDTMMGLHGLWWLFWVVVIALLVWVSGVYSSRSNRPRETPHEVLRRRLASGEISIEEYEKRKAILDRDS